MLLRSYTCSIPCLRSSHIWSKLIGLRPCWWELAGVYVAIVVYEMYKNWEKLPLTGYTVRQKWLCSEATVSCCTLQLTDTARIIFHINVPFTSMQWFQPTCLKRANQPALSRISPRVRVRVSVSIVYRIATGGYSWIWPINQGLCRSSCCLCHSVLDVVPFWQLLILDFERVKCGFWCGFWR